jgi:hypothetical protein
MSLDEGSQEILNCHASILLEVDHTLDDGGHIIVCALGIGFPVPTLLRRAKFESRQVDVIDAGLDVLGIEGALPLLVGLFPWHLRKPACQASIDGCGSALHQDGVDGLGLEEEELAPEIHIGLDAQVGLVEGCKC